jgi:hypothetical protein
MREIEKEQISVRKESVYIYTRDKRDWRERIETGKQYDLKLKWQNERSTTKRKRLDKR